jgi:hypothetical protein
MLTKLIRLLRTEPVLVCGAGQVAVALLITLGLNLTPEQTGAIEAFTTAALGVAVSWNVRPVAVTSGSGLVAASVTLLAAFGIDHIQPGAVSLVNAAVVALLMHFRGQVTPLAAKRPAA